MAQQENTGNSNVGMQADSFEEADAKQPKLDSSDFFGALEDQVNGAIQDKNTEATHQVQSGSEQVTHTTPTDGSNNVSQEDTDTGWQKRYQDSSREAVKLKEQLNNLKPFVPVLDAMKKDSGLVDHVREYLVNGGKPAKSIQERLQLPEDFVFDQQEAMTNPDSDSAKVMQAHVDGLVQKRVSQVVQSEKQNAQRVQLANKKKQDALEFKQKHQMNDEQFAEFLNRAKSHVLTLDDVNYLMKSYSCWFCKFCHKQHSLKIKLQLTPLIQLDKICCLR